jgi:hypothetical protein
MYPLTNTFEFEYKYKYPYLYFSGYRYRIFGIYFHISIPNQNPLEKWNLEPIVVGWGADLSGLLRTYMRTQSRFFSTWDKWQPESNSNSPHPKLSLLFFLAKTEKIFSNSSHLRLPFISSWEKPTPCAHIWAQQSARASFRIRRGGRL